MKDTHYISKLSTFVDRELSKDEQQTVAEHLMACPDCRREHDRIKFAAGLASKLERRAAPQRVWSNIENKLDGKREERETTEHIFRTPVFAGYAIASIFLCLFVGAAYFFLMTGEPYQAKQPPQESPNLPLATNALPITETNVDPNLLAQNTNSNSANVAAITNSAASPQPANVAAQSFEFETLAGSPKVGSLSTDTNLAVGDFLETDAVSKARIEVADIGNVEIRPNSRVKLVGTNPKQHRLALDRGSLHAKIYAPPRLFIVDTPTATAVDLGCEYTLDVDEKGNNKLHVTSGFVALERGGRESIVPAGAMCLTRKGRGLGTPFSADTSEAFRQALERFDFAGGGSRAVDEMLSNKSFYDIISLWHLLSRVPKADRERIFDALASYVGPPETVTRLGVLSLNNRMLEAWREAVERAWFEQ